MDTSNKEKGAKGRGANQGNKGKKAKSTDIITGWFLSHPHTHTQNKSGGRGVSSQERKK